MTKQNASADGSVASSSSLSVDVTADDIAAGEGGNCWRCPIALAIDRVMPEFRAWVSGETVELVPRDRSQNTERKAELPWEAVEFAGIFDELREYAECVTDEDYEAFRDAHGIAEDDRIAPEGVEPFTFVLDLSDNGRDSAESQRCCYPPSHALAKAWCERNRRWQRICDIDDSDSMTLGWEEITAKERAAWEEEYRGCAQSAWEEFCSCRPTRHRFGHIGDDGQFYGDILDVPRLMNTMMVFETGGPAGRYYRGGRGVRSGSRAFPGQACGAP